MNKKSLAQLGNKNHQWKEVDLEKIKKLYLQDLMSLSQIEKLIGLSRSQIKLRLMGMNIPIRDFKTQSAMEMKKESVIEKKRQSMLGKKNHQYLHGLKVGTKLNRKI